MGALFAVGGFFLMLWCIWTLLETMFGDTQ